MTHGLPSRLPVRLLGPLPGERAQRQMQPELSFGRHFGPPPPTARPAAVLVLLYPGPDDWRLPLTLRPKHLADHPGQVSLPGGAIEPGETCEQAAVRELGEELGVDARDVELLRPMTPLYLYHSDFLVEPWLGVVRRAPQWRPNVDEVAELLEVPLAALSAASEASSIEREYRGLRFRAPCLRLRNHEVWGATAMILAELAELIDPRSGDAAARE